MTRYMTEGQIDNAAAMVIAILLFLLPDINGPLLSSETSEASRIKGSEVRLTWQPKEERLSIRVRPREIRHKCQAIEYDFCSYL